MEAIQICLENSQVTGDAFNQRQTTTGSKSQQTRQQMSGARRNPHQSTSVHTANHDPHDKLSTMDDHHTDNTSMYNMHRDPSAKSVFQVAYSQKSEKQGPANHH